MKAGQLVIQKNEFEGPMENAAFPWVVLKMIKTSSAKLTEKNVELPQRDQNPEGVAKLVSHHLTKADANKKVKKLIAKANKKAA